MEGTLQSKWAQRRPPVPRLLLQLSSQTGHALMADTLLFSSLIHSRHNPTTSWVPTEGMGVTATGWAFLVAKGTHTSAYVSALELCMLGLRAAPCPSLPTDPPQHTHGPLQKGSVQRPPTAACHLPKLFKSALSVNIF